MTGLLKSNLYECPDEVLIFKSAMKELLPGIDITVSNGNHILGSFQICITCYIKGNYTKVYYINGSFKTNIRKITIANSGIRNPNIMAISASNYIKRNVYRK